jgi:hypothetical protein
MAVPEKAKEPIEFNCDPLPKLTVANNEQSEKTLALIVVTASGIATERRPLAPNADCPIDVTELGRSTDFKAVQP